MPFDISITEIRFSDGTRVGVPPRGVVAIVGPNNAGKTAALRDILGHLESGTAGQVIHNVQFSVTGSAAEVIEWLSKNWHRQVVSSNVGFICRRSSEAVYLQEREIPGILARRSGGLSDLAKFVGLMLNAEVRLGAAHSTAAPDVERGPLAQDQSARPIQQLLLNEALENEVRRETLRNFGAEFIIRRAPGQKVLVHWGKEPPRQGGVDRVSAHYLEELQKIPLLDDQGDGVRSFVGTLLWLKVACEFVVMIDEPEAFLHPPQERRLGTLIGQLAADRQVFVASHSSNFLRGLMDGRPDELVIVHLRREGAKNRPKVLQSEALNKAWADPMLRYSNILDGLFHDLVVLCEGETDCRFYHAAFDHLWTIRGAGDTPQPSVLFADVGGKDAFKRAAWVLTAFGVPLKVIADFDLLNREGLLSELCLSLGANGEEFKATWRIVSNAIQKKGSAPLQVEELVKNVKEKCANEGKRRLDQNLSDELVAIVRYPSPWSDAKRTGKKIIPPGQETAALESLLDKLRDVGVHVVPEGEVEGWIRIVGGKSMRWLVQVFVEIEAKRVQFPEELLAFLSMVLQLGLKGDSNLPSNDISISSYDSTRSDKQPVNLGPMPAIGIERTFTWRLRRWSFVWIALLLLIFALGVVLFWPF